MTKETISAYFQTLQDRICESLETADGGATFREDHWQRPGGGGGRSRTMQGGAIIEKGGVGFSAVHGEMHEQQLKSLNINEKVDFFATGVSIVMHPNSPQVPIIHMNVRYFEMSNGTCWFGGGIDLTPHYVVADDAQWFHQQLKAVCDKHDVSYYPKFKTWADDYFYIPHRQETRGVGGIFFDYLKPSATLSKEAIFSFVQEVGEAFAPIYTHLMLKNKDLPFGEAEKHWQLLRRGRYVEFNLVWDRGTKFGLETNGRTESILMSMPPQANWIYDYHPTEGSLEAATLTFLQKGINWAE
ncbi:MAG: oxygen-dependent coproporphyrinogen oxidase [Spirosomataceae bacterium]